MSWAADRVTTRKEDGAYSLMGIFGINMPLLYGEGDKAFYRLQEEIMRVSDDHSLFAWRFPGTKGGLLAPAPAAFKDSGNIVPWNPFAPYNSPFTTTNKGVHIEAPFIAQDISGRGLCVLCCTAIGTRDKLIAVHLRDLYLTMEHFDRCRSGEFEWINLDTFSLTHYPARSLCVRLQIPAMARKSRRYEGEDEAMPGRNNHPDSNLSLSEAALRGNAGTVWFILANKLGVSNVTDDEVRSAICLAARGGHEHLISQLMTRRDSSSYLINSDGRTALSYAAEAGQEHIVRFILSSARILPDTRDANGLTALWYAVYRRHTACAKLLLQKGLVSGSVGGSGDTQSALWHATSAGNVELVKLLLCNKALDGAQGEPALIAAVNLENITIAELLLEHGADPDERDVRRNTPLHLACRNGNHDIVALLMRHGADSDRIDSSGKTYLAFATFRGDVPLVKTLLENGANPRAKCANGKTAAAYAQGQQIKSLFENQRWYKMILDRTNTNRSSLSGR
jgi:ankyrin repeat protein